MKKRDRLPHRVVRLPIVVCFASMTVAAPAFADCRAPQTQVAFNLPWNDPRPSAIQTPADIHVWKTITLGIYRDLSILGIALDEAGCGIGDDVDAMFKARAIPLAHDRKDVDLVVLSVAQLGFPREASRAEIFARAEQLGLELCSPEVGPLLRLQYAEQPIGEFLRIAMVPVRTANGQLDDMLVGNGGAGQLLVGAAVRPDETLSWDVLLVFARKSSDKSTIARQ
jgi:hypothetical protein